MGVMDATKRIEGLMKAKTEEKMDAVLSNYAYIGELTIDQYTKLCDMIGNTVNILAMGTNCNNYLYIVVDKRDTDEDVVETLQRFFSLIGD